MFCVCSLYVVLLIVCISLKSSFLFVGDLFRFAATCLLFFVLICFKIELCKARKIIHLLSFTLFKYKAAR